MKSNYESFNSNSLNHNQRFTINYFIFKYRCETAWKLHEATGFLKTETQLNKDLIKAHELTLSAILDMTEEEEISKKNCDILTNLICTCTDYSN